MVGIIIIKLHLLEFAIVKRNSRFGTKCIIIVGAFTFRINDLKFLKLFELRVILLFTFFFFLHFYRLQNQTVTK